jgi:hypothetical protein
MASACGTVYGLRGDYPAAITVSGAQVDSQECTTGSLDGLRQSGWNACLQCPVIKSQTKYVALLTGDNGPSQRVAGLSRLAMVNITTADVTPPTFVTGPWAVDVSTDSFALQFQLDEAGIVHYVVAYSSLQAQYFSAYLLSFTQAGMSVEQVISQANLSASTLSIRPDGVVAAGSILVAQQQTGTHNVRPNCTGAACNVAENVNATMLAPSTSYTVFLVPEDNAGNIPSSSASQYCQLRFHLLHSTSVQSTNCAVVNSRAIGLLNSSVPVCIVWHISLSLFKHLCSTLRSRHIW